MDKQSQSNSKRYLVLANQQGTRGTPVPFEFPNEHLEASSNTQSDYQAPIGIAYEHSDDVYGDGFNRNLVGHYIVTAVEESKLVGKLAYISRCDIY